MRFRLEDTVLLMLSSIWTDDRSLITPTKGRDGKFCGLSGLDQQDHCTNHLVQKALVDT